jgi:ubiquinone/menaquinone biosynthesis C-methylase UbiE
VGRQRQSGGISGPSYDSVRQHYDGVAGGYDRRNRVVETCLLAVHRAWLGREASGRTLEIGVGTGLNIAHYHDAEVIGIDLSAAMLAQARQKAASPLAIADARTLPFPSATFDTVTATLVLSAVPDPRGVMDEVQRVLRPRGRFLAIEKTRSRVPRCV